MHQTQLGKGRADKAPHPAHPQPLRCTQGFLTRVLDYTYIREGPNGHLFWKPHPEGCT